MFGAFAVRPGGAPLAANFERWRASAGYRVELIEEALAALEPLAA